MEVLDYSPDLTVKEIERLGSLEEYGLMGTLAEAEYDDITKLAAFICQTPISQITLVGEDRTWYKSSFGMEVQEVPREISICAHALNTPEVPLIIEDLTTDDRFKAYPYVGTEKPGVTFYSGVPW